MFVVDDEKRAAGWVVVHAPIQSPSRRALFAEYRRLGYGFIGMASFMEFPSEDPDDPLDYQGICEGWCHCFREPERFLTSHHPRVLLSYSDFVDPQIVSSGRLGPDRADAPGFDFIYLGADRPWKMKAKNWSLARKCLKRLCGELGLRGLVVGAPPDEMPAIRGLTSWPWLPYVRFLQVLSRCRFLFAPYALDASPRVLTESLCLDVPLLVYRRILGGWKYVVPSTGVFFDHEDNVTEAAAACLNGSFHPRSWYRAHYGPERAGQTLRLLMEQVDPGFKAKGTLGLSYGTGPASGDGR